MKEDDRVVTPTSEADSLDDQVLDHSLRPSRFSEFVGQPKMREQLEIFISAAKSRSEALDHVLVFGPPGLGKPLLHTLSPTSWG